MPARQIAEYGQLPPLGDTSRPPGTPLAIFDETYTWQTLAQPADSALAMRQQERQRFVRIMLTNTFVRPIPGKVSASAESDDPKMFSSRLALAHAEGASLCAFLAQSLARRRRLGNTRTTLGSGGPMKHALVWCLLAGLGCCGSVAKAGAPDIKEGCRDRQGREVRVRYDSRFETFAEARLGPPGPAVIYINPDVYFVGSETQQWLYERQCIHIQRDDPVIRDGERGLKLEDEERVDCLALKVMTDQRPSSARTLRSSIESDIGRAMKEDKWRRLLPGPPRRVLLQRC